ncbi:hypothetical protein ACIA6D_30520 [Streptomyces cacaoi]
MSGQPATPVIDTRIILRDGDKALLSQRGGPYGYGRRHMPSGKLDQGDGQGLSLPVVHTAELAEAARSPRKLDLMSVPRPVLGACGQAWAGAR